VVSTLSPALAGPARWYCDAACQLVHWRSPTDPHKARCTGCHPQDAGVSKQQYRSDRNARMADLKQALKKPPA